MARCAARITEALKKRSVELETVPKGLEADDLVIGKVAAETLIYWKRENSRNIPLLKKVGKRSIIKNTVYCCTDKVTHAYLG